MNVKFLSILLLLAGGALSATLQLGTVRRPPASAVKRIARPGGGFPARRGAMARSLDGEDGEEEEEEKQYPGLFDEDEEEEAEGLSPPPTPDSPDEALAKLNFETQEVQDAVGFIEFKMNEMNVLIQQCIDEQFEIDVMADVKVVKHECVGTTFQVLFFSYREGLRKLKDILLELLKIKLQQLDDIYEDEANFFIDLLNELIDMDYSLPQSLLVAKKASRFYVSPRFFDNLIEISKPELRAFHKLHKKLREARNEIQKNLEAHESKQEDYIEMLETRAETAEAQAPEQYLEEEEEEEPVEAPKFQSQEPEEEADIYEPEESPTEEIGEAEEEAVAEEATDEEETTGDAEGSSGGGANAEAGAGEAGGEAGGEAASGGASNGESKGGAGEAAAGGAAEGGEGSAPAAPQEGGGGDASLLKRKLQASKFNIRSHMFKRPQYVFKSWKPGQRANMATKGLAKGTALHLANSQIKFKNPNWKFNKHI